MISQSRSPAGVMSAESERDDSPPPAPDVTADPRAPRSHVTPPTAPPNPCGADRGPFVPSGMRNNEVRSVMLYGIPIVALVIDGQERLCLAQISNTLLKSFSYNEIHNRRVALGITCVQCTPVQLELLRRAGAMPVSSRRCGLITKREAERLCKSFLADTCPPKLPDNFAFDVFHQCAWGCRGSFVPSRYNSSRAKCIKCAYCGLFFSPNKFIFHSHRLPDSKYVQPDAANFNSWRRHIQLSGSPPEEVLFAWEDVKAMFNGGSRKRVLASSLSSISRSSESKRPRFPTSSEVAPSTADTESPSKPAYFPVVPLPNKGYTLQTTAPFVSPTAPSFGLVGKPISPADIRQSFAEYMWAGKQPFPIPYGGVLWPRPAGLVPSAVDLRENRTPEACTTSTLPYSLADTTIPDSGQSRPLSSASDCTSRSFPGQDTEEGSPGSPRQSTGSQPSPAHTSAFRPVGRANGRGLHIDATNTPDSAVDTTTTTNGFEDGVVRPPHLRPDSHSSNEEDSDHDEVDVTDISNDGEGTPVLQKAGPTTVSSDDTHGNPPALIAVRELTSAVADTSATYAEKSSWKDGSDGTDEDIGDGVSSPATVSNTRTKTKTTSNDLMRLSSGSGSPQERQNTLSTTLDPERILSLSKVSAHVPRSSASGRDYSGRINEKQELRQILLQEAEARQRAEREYQLIRETFEEQVRKEIAYREEIAKQLQLVRAHDALHHFSCKMLTSRHCTECGYKPVLPE